MDQHVLVGGMNMRLFEILLLFLNICLLSSLFVTNPRLRKLALLLTSGISFILVIIHLLVEGYRIQLLFLYGLTILMLIRSVIDARRTPKSTPYTSKIGKVLGRLVSMIGLIATACLLYIFPVFDLPAPTGSLPVSTTTFHFTNDQQQDIFGTSGKGNRELMVQVWYPSEANTGKYVPFIPDASILPYMAKNYSLPEFTFQHLQYVSSHSYSEGALSSAQTSYPLIIANPGNASSRFLHTSQAENLASHGYIVAVIDHTYNTFATKFPDGRITTSTTDNLFSPDHDYPTERANRDKLGKVLTDDVTFVLDQFQLLQSGSIPSLFKGKIDLAHIGVFGHSIGGATAYDASYDPRITAGIDLDGGLYRLQDRAALRKPFLFINSQSNFEQFKMVIDHHIYTDEEIQRTGNSKEWFVQERKNKKLERQRIHETMAFGGQVLYIQNTEHLNFTDVQFISPLFQMIGITGKIAPERASSIIDAYMLDFFEMHLKNKGGTLIKGSNPTFQEVKFVTSLF